MRLRSTLVPFASLVVVAVPLVGACDPCALTQVGTSAADREALAIAPGIDALSLEGATGVPLNADLWAQTYAGLSGDETARLIDATVDGLGTVDVPISARGASLARGDLPALSPSTTYTIELDGPQGFRTVGFTTGERDDDQAPTVNGDPRVEVSDLGAGICAGPGRAVVVTLDDVTDDTGVVAAQLFRTVDGERQELAGTLVRGEVQLYGTLEDTEGVVDLTVVVLDAAGHEASVDVSVDVGPAGLVEAVEG